MKYSFASCKICKQQSINASTNVSSFYIMYGVHFITPSILTNLSKVYEFSTKLIAVNEFVEHIQRRLHQEKKSC